MKTENQHKLGTFHVGFMYIGAIMGAGFASGREIWQFFGVFGNHGYVGILIIGLLFLAIGLMTSKIAATLKTNDMGKIIVPGENEKLIGFVGYFMALILFTVLISMSAAAGSLFNQQFGINRVLGGLLITVLVIATVIGGFDRVSGVFKFVMPVLMAVVVGTCIIVIFSDLPDTGSTEEIFISPLTPNWFISALLYMSYNVLALIPIAATASLNAKSEKHGLLGTGLGSLFLGGLAFILQYTLFTDSGLSSSMDMPMLAFSAKLSPVVNAVYTCIMLFAIYAAATSNFYGFTTKIKPCKHREIIITVVAGAGFVFGLMGFKNVISFMFPVEGMLGLIIIAVLTVNFFYVTKKKRKKERQEHMN